MATKDRADDAGRSRADRIASLFDAHHQRLYGLALRLSSGKEEAEDLVQETFLRAVRFARTIPNGARGEEAWLVRVLVNLKRDAWRRSATRKRIDPEGQADALRPKPADIERDLIVRTAVWRALEQLSPRRQAALVLHELEGVPMSEIGKLLGISAVTVRWHVSIGRHQLATLVRRQKGAV